MITIRENHNSINQGLTELQSRLNDLTPVMRVISGVMGDAVEENFAQQGRPAWKKLKSSTIKQREKKGYWPGNILQQSGDLASSVVAAHNSKSARVSTNKEYAAAQHLGFEGTVKVKAHTRKGKEVKAHTREMKIEPREFLKLAPSDIRTIENNVERFLTAN